MLVQQFLEESAARVGDKVALVCGPERLTYQQVNSLGVLRHVLVRLGVACPDHTQPVPIEAETDRPVDYVQGGKM